MSCYIRYIRYIRRLQASCPNLRPEAFVVAKLRKQMDEQVGAEGWSPIGGRWVVMVTGAEGWSLRGGR